MRILTVVTAAAVSLSATTALAAEGVGEAMAVIDAASASGQVGERTLAVGSRVFIGDLLATDAIGEAQLLFTDGTRMVVGPNSSLVIDEFLFRGDAAENRFAVRALGGAFRFISGDSGDHGYSIQTPSGTIGVRGTAFDLTVTRSGGTKLVLLQGIATFCAEGGDCATVATPCGLLTNTGRKVEEIEAGNGRVQETRRHFPYMTSQSSLLEPFRLDRHGCTADAAGSETGIEGVAAVASAPAAAPAPAPDLGKSNNGHGNGGELSQGEDPDADPDPSNPGKGGGTAGDISDGPGDVAASSAGDSTGGGNDGGNGGGNDGDNGGVDDGGNGHGNGNGNGGGNRNGGGNGNGNGKG